MAKTSTASFVRIRSYETAHRPRDGVFRQADGGTLFLDQIGDMPAGVQTRLLRVLQENVVQPVGSEELISVNVRIISATHQNLEDAMAEGKNILPQDLGLASRESSESSDSFERYFDLPLTEARNQLLDDFDRAAIERALKQENGNISAAARALGIHRQSLQQKMKSLGISHC